MSGEKKISHTKKKTRCIFSIQVTCVWKKKFFFHSVNEALALVELNLRQSVVCLWLGSIERGYLKHKNPIFSEITKMHKKLLSTSSSTAHARFTSKNSSEKKI